MNEISCLSVNLNTFQNILYEESRYIKLDHDDYDEEDASDDDYEEEDTGENGEEDEGKKKK